MHTSRHPSLHGQPLRHSCRRVIGRSVNSLHAVAERNRPHVDMRPSGNDAATKFESAIRASAQQRGESIEAADELCPSHVTVELLFFPDAHHETSTQGATR